MRESIPLFCTNDLASQLRTRQDRVRLAVDDIPEDNFLISSDGEIVEFVISKFLVEPLSLQEDATTMKKTETPVDVSADPMRHRPPGHFSPFYVFGTRVEVDIPFMGERWLLQFRTSTYFDSVPFAEVNKNALRISILLPHDVEPEQFKTQYERDLKLLKQYIVWSSEQVNAYNESLPQVAKQAIDSRRERLRRHAGVSELLGIPLETRKGAPSITPVKVEVRQPPPLPVPPKSGLKPEPGITDETYEHILQFIRHQGRTFETAPATYSVHDEEGLRDIVLAQLNGHFEGAAAGEVFRKRGKTDIRIEQDSRAAFVGECKLWAGPISLTGALEQLLGYLTWRDSKASVIIFNSKNKNFSKILEVAPETMQSHPLFVRELPCEEAGEWRIQMYSKEDEGRRVTVHTFVFNLYQN